MRQVLTGKDSPKTFAGLPGRKTIKARLLAPGYEDPASNSLANTAKMAHRSSEPDLLCLAALRECGVRRMDISTASSKNGDINRKVCLARPAEAGASQGNPWRALKAIYGLTGGPSGFYHTFDDFLCDDEVWGAQVGYTFVQTAPGPWVYRIAKVPENEDSSLASVPGVDAGEEIVELMSTHADDLPLAPDDRARGMVGKVLAIPLDLLKHRSPPYTHCGLCVSEDMGKSAH